MRYMAIVLSLLGACFCSVASAQNCDKRCLELIADQYRSAYLAHDPSQLSISDSIRFTENFVEMKFPEATWDTVTEEVGPALTLSDPVTGQIAIFTSILQMDTPGFLAIRLKVENQQITEIEHVISTRRNLSGPPTPIADSLEYEHDPVINEIVPVDERLSRKLMIAHAHGYFDTLQRNDGKIRGTRFSPDATRHENGKLFTDIEAGFKTGFYYFNDEGGPAVIASMGRSEDHFIKIDEKWYFEQRIIIVDMDTPLPE